MKTGNVRRMVARYLVGTVMKTAELGAGAASWFGFFQKKTPTKLFR